MLRIMATAIEQIIPAKFPELRKLLWNRDPQRPIPEEEAFALYERNRRFVDRDQLTDAESRLLKDLGDKFGRGFGLV
jgi:hypothetical protein